ncbi:hypothetical protein [Streptomyces sp. NPDC058644]|uniref:hypothetical protein n=1 Tax=unclassified Streptomyces TaxID=2593676 RepID=UPI00365B8439
MSETTPNSKGPAPVQSTPAATEPAPIPADQVKPEDIGTLSIAYRDGQPVVVVSGGKYIPQNLPVLNEERNPVAVYTARPISQPQVRSTGDHPLIYDQEHGLFDVSYAAAWTLGR